MLGRGIVFNAVAFICLLLRLAHADVDPVITKGSKFFYKTNGTEFIVRGVQFQVWDSGSGVNDQNIDMLADTSVCEGHVGLLLALNINVLRIIYVDATKDHSGCMEVFADAGIYVLPELVDPQQLDAMQLGSWDRVLFTSMTDVVNSLVGFNNLLGFSIGVTSLRFTANAAAPYWKAAVRDLKEALKEQQRRAVPIGLSTRLYPAGDNRTNVNELDFFTCDDNHVDFLGLHLNALDTKNCTPSASIADAAQLFSNATVPIFIDEYGCQFPTKGTDNRKFDQVETIYSQELSGILAGGVLAEFFRHNISDGSQVDYGLVTADRTTPKLSPGYDAFSSAMAAIKPKPTNSVAYNPTATARPSCPTQAAGSAWLASSVLPPKPFPELCECMFNTTRCVAKSRQFSDNPNWITSTGTADSIYKKVCNESESDCTGVRANSTSGVYHAFSTCNAIESYSYIANHYWERHSNGTGNFTGPEGGCDSLGLADLRDPQPAISDECSFLLDQVGTNGEKWLTATALPVSTTASSSAGGPTSLAPPSPSNSGLTRNAKIGVAVGVSAAAILILIAILFILRLLKQKKKARQALDRMAEQPKAELHGTNLTWSEIYRDATEMPKGQGMMAEAPVPYGARPAINIEPVELPVQSKPGELQSGGISDRHEADAGRPRSEDRTSRTSRDNAV
ncbi:Glucanosyltransferase-domain-containing protein [Lophiotrema nucula]|uniref:1,3-beta-glucanosyltransferase n=1 Tax=Lophiotrema nucula TaxID=690887 RepID=A0A6A5YHE0_9PLEO|nr:Glucanosyltransferase-domain-containing protein [Lophiotrema nucula]